MLQGRPLSRVETSDNEQCRHRRRSFIREARLSQSLSKLDLGDANVALDYLKSALEILDAVGAPGSIGARLDFVICELCDFYDLKAQSAD